MNQDTRTITSLYLLVVNGLPSTSQVSLSSMAGENGGLLATTVLNTVQTGSVPSETAGQSGTSNTGASAGDTQGKAYVSLPGYIWRVILPKLLYSLCK